MYVRATVAALLIVAVRSQLCGFKTNEQCIEDLNVCRHNTTHKLNQRLLSIPGHFAEEAAEKVQRRAHDFFTNPVRAFQNAFEEDSKDFRSGVEASTAVTKILTGSLKPLLELIRPTNNPTNAATAPVKIILQTLIILKNFTDDEALRNNSQVDKILDIIIPNIQIVNDEGIRCGANAVGGLLQYPLRGVAFAIGKILDYMMNCYSISEQEATESCQLQSTLVELTLSAGIWILKTLLSFIPE